MKVTLAARSSRTLFEGADRGRHYQRMALTGHVLQRNLGKWRLAGSRWQAPVWRRDGPGFRGDCEVKAGAAPPAGAGKPAAIQLTARSCRSYLLISSFDGERAPLLRVPGPVRALLLRSTGSARAAVPPHRPSRSKRSAGIGEADFVTAELGDGFMFAECERDRLSSVWIIAFSASGSS